MDELNTLYMELRKQKEDYVFYGQNVEIILRLAEYCPTNQDTLFWFLGGPLFWIFQWRATNKKYRENHISKTEKKIIAILSKYDQSFKKGYCLLIRKDL